MTAIARTGALCLSGQYCTSGQRLFKSSWTSNQPFVVGTTTLSEILVPSCGYRQEAEHWITAIAKEWCGPVPWRTAVIYKVCFFQFTDKGRYKQNPLTSSMIQDG